MKFAKNIWELVIQNVIVLGHVMADTSSKRQKTYILCEICHISTSYIAKIMFMYLVISHESHFQLQVLPTLTSIRNTVFCLFQNPVTGFDFCKRSHHYLQETPLWLRQSFSSGRGKPNFRGSRGHFRPHCR